MVVDEASTDNTLAMLAAEFPEARVIKHETARGPSAARNAGIAAATGEWVLFLDDDDVLHPEHLESLVKASKDVPQGAVVSGRWRRFTVVVDKVRIGPIVCAPPDRRGLDTLAEILEPMGEGTICGHSLLWPRALLAKVPWDERLSANGDSDFFGRCHPGRRKDRRTSGRHGLLSRPPGRTRVVGDRAAPAAVGGAIPAEMVAAAALPSGARDLRAGHAQRLHGAADRLVRPAGSARPGADPERCLLVVGRQELLRLQPAQAMRSSACLRPASCGLAGRPGCIGC